jgi:hypothetical protein
MPYQALHLMLFGFIMNESLIFHFDHDFSNNYNFNHYMCLVIQAH